MINLSILSFLALLEIIVVLLIVIAVQVWRARRIRQKGRIQYIDGSDDHPTPALYLESEVAKTRTHLELLNSQPEHDKTDPQAAALNLRMGLLAVEAELAETPAAKRDAQYWQQLADRLGEIVATTGYQAQAVTAAEEKPVKTVYVMGEEDASVKGLVEQQAKTIEFLRGYIQDLLDQHGHSPSPEPEIAGRFDELERANKELSSCVAVLEDENEFLRDQIAALLKME